MPLGNSELERLIVGMIDLDCLFTVLADSTFFRETDERIFYRRKHRRRHLRSCERKLQSVDSYYY